MLMVALTNEVTELGPDHPGRGWLLLTMILMMVVIHIVVMVY